MKEIKKILNKIEHPEIKSSLVELNMIGKITEKNDSIEIELKLPFPNVPIKQLLIDSIINAFPDQKVKVKIALMDNKERENFREMAMKNWKF